ncbi:MAG: hypothetical protein CL755_12630 [Chloroflexi bacterium]|nr:hypothetical protein [Chloroflexota bacterium]|tara:strand:- start:990 stop:1268 length:279 start_codon:yes stop_codon:yes gene_type:complete
MATKRKRTTKRKPSLVQARKTLASSARNLEKTASDYDTQAAMKKKYGPRGIHDPNAKKYYTTGTTKARNKHNLAKKAFDKAQRAYRKSAGRK